MRSRCFTLLLLCSTINLSFSQEDFTLIKNEVRAGAGVRCYFKNEGVSKRDTGWLDKFEPGPTGSPFTVGSTVSQTAYNTVTINEIENNQNSWATASSRATASANGLDGSVSLWDSTRCIAIDGWISHALTAAMAQTKTTAKINKNGFAKQSWRFEGDLLSTVMTSPLNASHRMTIQDTDGNFITASWGISDHKWHVLGQFLPGPNFYPITIDFKTEILNQTFEIWSSRKINGDQITTTVKLMGGGPTTDEATHLRRRYPGDSSKSYDVSASATFIKAEER